MEKEIHLTSELKFNTSEKEGVENNDQPVLDALSQSYGLSKLSFLREPEKGISTRNIIASAEEGSTFFIKRHKKAELDRIESSERAARYVSENSDVPVVLPSVNKAGESHAVIEGQVYSVFPYVSHAVYSPDLKGERIVFTKNLGEMLSKIHSVSQNIPIPETIKPISAWDLNDQLEIIAKYERILKLIGNKEDIDDYDKKASEFIRMKISLLEGSEFVKRDNELAVVCHGDFHGGNLLFDEQGGIIGVCDWDMSGVGNPYSEFIISFNMCVIRRDFEHLADKKELSKAFLNGYTSKCGFEFNMSELEYAIEAWYEKLLTLQWPLTDHYYLGHSKTDPSLDSEYDKVIFLRDRRKELFTFIKSCL